MAAKHIRVLLPRNTQPDHDVEEVGGSVLANVYNNKNFNALPVDQPMLQAALTDFTASIAATLQGGSQATNEKNKKKHELVALLRKLGLYVQANSNEDPAILTSSGFHAASRIRIRGPLPKAVIAAVVNGHTTQLLATVETIPKAAAYELYFASVGNDGAIGEWKHVVTVTSPRQIPVDDLKPGATYAFKARAVGGTNGYGDFSDPVTHMSL